LQPLSQAILLESFPPEKRGQAMAFWALGIVVAPMLGPVAGGWLTDNYSWRWVFYINVPIGVLALFLTQAFIFDPPYLRKESKGIDYWGIGLLVLGIGSLQIMLDKGQEEDWFASTPIRILAALAVIGLVAFVIRELRTDHPVVDLRVLKVRTYATGVFLMTVLGFVLYGSLVLLPILLQTLLGYPSFQAGIALAPRGMGSFLAMPIVGAILFKFGPRRLLALGLIGGGLTLLWYGQLDLDAGYWDIFWPQFLQGMCLGLLFVPLTTISMDPIPKENMGNATSIFNLMRNIGGSFGIAAATTMLYRRTQLQTTLLGAHVTPFDVPARSMLRGLTGAMMARGADLATATQQARALAFGLVSRQASMLAFVGVFRLLGFLFLALVPLLLLMRSPKGRSGGVAAH
jgi:MFS transporter, DHA2 family, multidrug resistance protein